ncbi:hypothetical protein GZ77_25380 [Endozoicomonas montiporae]|uniref:Lipoprotein n=2 Tax=Endozoicomonas montiporae TaxID=1027273 RepID=A0A081MZ15_9GAMM|nr:DUF6279 family lipoprotein [Endozoicomonas montiporae]AMO54910.1 hypothetical protein EZMO1_0671 [Endozoicomonas montiporae CL-33]KEQ11438.1 hypothetical protein GZ77_25380 [Endozoicomonas montiporae]
MNTIKRVCCLFLLMMLPFLPSCSTTYVYDNLDWLVHWYVDDYVTLTPTQKQDFDRRFSQLQQWHKNSELQEYQLWLESIRDQLMNKELSRHDILVSVRSHRMKSLTFWQRLVSEAEPHLLQLLDQLSDQQQQELTENIRKQLLKRYDRREALGRKGWERDKVARMEKGLKPWVGKLGREQKKLLMNWAVELHNLDQQNREFRLDWLARLTELRALPLSQRRGKFAMLVVNPDHFRTTDHLQKLDENRELTDRVIAEVIALLSQRQNKMALAEIEQWLQRIKSTRS